MKRPTIRPHLRAQTIPGEGVYVLADGRSTLLRGRLYELVVPHLDGETTADELCDRLSDKATAAEVFFTLKQLERKQLVCEAHDSLDAGQGAFWSVQGILPGDAAQRLKKWSISVQGCGLEATGFLALLQALHVRLTDGPPDVVLTDNYLREDLAALNARALEAGRSWLLVKPTGRQIWVGPLFRPGVTGCWACLAERMRANSPVPSYLRERNGAAGIVSCDVAHTPALEHVAWGLAANTIAGWIVRGEAPEVTGAIQSFDVVNWKVQSHRLMQLPFCPACGTGQPRAFHPPRLERRPKIFTADGGHRTVSPEETLNRHGHHVSPITGAIPMLERTGPGEGGVMHVYIAGTNMARPHKSLAHLRGDLRNMSSGKGTTDVQAKASGLCEGLERYSGVFRGDEPRRLARMRDLGEAAIHLNDCLLFSDLQYRDRDERNKSGSRFSFIPQPFDPDAEIEWSPLWSLTRQEVRYLPTAFCYYECHQPDSRIHCIACSNGNAAGNTLEEAILQGFLELVERDGVALWWYNRLRRPAVNLADLGEPYLEELAAFLRERGREFWVLDLTTDLGVPVFASITRRTDCEREQIALGFGAHLDPRLGLLRAVTEMNQMLSSALLAPGAKDDPHADRDTAEWLAAATIANQPYLTPAESLATSLKSFPRLWTDDLLEDVALCRSRVERAGLELLVLDQTRPEIGLPVVKVVAPGLRHFWTRLAPGRLYDTPVQLGWLDRPLTEAELNPIPMFL